MKTEIINFLADAEAGDIEGCRHALMQGVDVQAVNEHAETALFFAAKHGHHELCAFLCGQGARDMNTWNGDNPLRVAARNGHLEVCRVLIAAGFDVNVKDPTNDYTALHEAAEVGFIDVAELLITNGAKLEVRAGYDQTPLALAAGKSDEAMMRLLIGQGAQLDPGGMGNSALYAVVDDNSPQVLALSAMLIGMGANVNAKREKDYSVLHRAVDLRNLALCKMLVEAGANHSLVPDVQRYDPDELVFNNHLSPFQLAVSKGLDEFVTYFVLECGEDLDQTCEPLHNAPLSHMCQGLPRMQALLQALRTEVQVRRALSSDDAPAVGKRTTSLSPL